MTVQTAAILSNVRFPNASLISKNCITVSWQLIGYIISNGDMRPPGFVFSIIILLFCYYGCYNTGLKSILCNEIVVCRWILTAYYQTLWSIAWLHGLRFFDQLLTYPFILFHFYNYWVMCTGGWYVLIWNRRMTTLSNIEYTTYDLDLQELTTRLLRDHPENPIEYLIGCLQEISANGRHSQHAEQKTSPQSSSAGKIWEAKTLKQMRKTSYSMASWQNRV